MGKKSGKQALFDGDDGDDGGGLLSRGGGGGGGRGLLPVDGDGSEAALGFNEEYARRFEHNKRREELHRLKEKNPRLAAKLEREAAREALGKQDEGSDDDGSDETSSSSDDDDDDLEELARRDDTDRVLEVLARLKKKDPSIKQPEVRFFDDDEDDEDDEDEGEEGGEAKKQKKPVFLRQVLAEQAIAGEDGEDDDGAARRKAKAAASRIPVYDDEQAQARAAFLDAAAAAADGGDDDGSGLVRRSQQAAAAAAAADGEKDARVQKLLSDYFGADEELDPDEKFLKQYLAGRRWLRQDSESDEPAAAEDEDADFEERADEFESHYNFRHEHGAQAGQLVGHPRVIPDAVRKKDDKRKRQREAKAERKALERQAVEADLKRLKNLKKAEIEDRLKAVQQVAGAGADAQLVDAILGDDFDPDAYDRQMAAAFGDDYYDQQEDPDAVQDERAAELLRQAGAIDDEIDEVPMPIGAPTKKSTKSIDPKKKPIDESAAADARADVSRLLQEYYSLDYEGMAGGMKTRFRYRQVEPSTGGLSVDEILQLDDKTLNSIVSLKLLAPYREGKVRPNYKALQAAREARQQQQGGKGRKSRQQHGGRGGGGGPAVVRLEREGEGQGEDKPWHQKWKKGAGAEQQQPQSHQPQDKKQSARAASFAPLSLAGQKRREGAGGGGGGDGDGPAHKKKSKGGGGCGGDAAAAPAPASAAGPALTKAQRKNAKRALKRAAGRQEKA